MNKKKIAYALIGIVLLIQFIRPARNQGEIYGPDHISQAMTVPAEVEQILSRSCYDCHSNNTRYPWYSQVQPLGWWLQHHVDEGKEELNFSAFKTYTEKRKAKKLHEIAEEVEEHEMPLESYTLIHTDAKLSDADRDILLKWCKGQEGDTETE